MKYLVRLVTPPNGVVLDPFNGSGSTGMAAVELGYDYVGCELDPEYVQIANNRISAWEKMHDTPANKLFD
jgi:site-specific DNA-methyltransferase (adenine-specific)